MNRQHSPTDLQNSMLEAIENDLRACLDHMQDRAYRTMTEMIEYHLGWLNPISKAQGKRFRPLLVLLCCQAAGGDWRTALPAASCLELIHNFSLIHDDIQDGSDMRRGQPAVWKRWGMPQAINTGDAVFVLARMAALRLIETGIPADRIVRVLSIIDLECLNLTKGQYLDLEFECRETVPEEEYYEMISGKTCALLRAAAQCGALVADCPEDTLAQYRSFGHQLGMAFQIIDDILGIWGQTEVTGKSNMSDLLSRKTTLPVIYGLKNSPKFSQRWLSERNTPGDIAELRHTLEDAGAEEYAREKADEATSRALQALEHARPTEPAATELKRLVSQLHTRNR